MPYIEHISLADAIKGNHHGNDILIRIIDPDKVLDQLVPSPFIPTKFNFKEVYYFRFLDLEKTDDPINDHLKISDEQASDLVNILQKALNENKNVTVHCIMGICRSGAVHEVGEMMGFTPFPGKENQFRYPNLLVKEKMMKVLGWGY